MKNRNNLPVTEVMSPRKKIKVANHPTCGVVCFFLCLYFVPSACSQASLPYVWQWFQRSFSRFVFSCKITYASAVSFVRCTSSEETRTGEEFGIPTTSLSRRNLHFKNLPQAKVKWCCGHRLQTQKDPAPLLLATANLEIKNKFPSLKIPTVWHRDWKSFTEKGQRVNSLGFTGQTVSDATVKQLL